jgi:hypothetical protein
MSLRVQIYSTRLCPTARPGNFLDGFDLEALANGGRKYGTHDSKMFVGDLSPLGELIGLVDELLHEPSEFVELLTRYGVLF